MYAKDILEGTAKVTIEKKSISELTKGTLTGATLGAMAGASIAFFQNYSYYKAIVIGMLAGGLISRIFILK